MGISRIPCDVHECSLARQLARFWHTTTVFYSRSTSCSLALSSSSLAFKDSDSAFSVWMVSPFVSPWQAIFNKTQMDDGWVRKYALYHEPRPILHSLHSWWCSDVSANVTWHITTISITFISGAHWLKPKITFTISDISFHSWKWKCKCMFLNHVFASIKVISNLNRQLSFLCNLFWLSAYEIPIHLFELVFGYFCNTTQIHAGIGGINNSAVLSEPVCFQRAW